MLEIRIQTSYDQNVQLILKSYLPVVYGNPLIHLFKVDKFSYFRTIVVLPNMTSEIVHNIIIHIR
jgi:hypothetical protein